MSQIGASVPQYQGSIGPLTKRLPEMCSNRYHVPEILINPIHVQEHKDTAELKGSWNASLRSIMSSKTIAGRFAIPVLGWSWFNENNYKFTRAMLLFNGFKVSSNSIFPPQISYSFKSSAWSKIYCQIKQLRIISALELKQAIIFKTWSVRLRISPKETPASLSH